MDENEARKRALQELADPLLVGPRLAPLTGAVVDRLEYQKAVDERDEEIHRLRLRVRELELHMTERDLENRKLHGMLDFYQQRLDAERAGPQFKRIFAEEGAKAGVGLGAALLTQSLLSGGRRRRGRGGT